MVAYRKDGKMRARRGKVSRYSARMVVIVVADALFLASNLVEDGVV